MRSFLLGTVFLGTSFLGDFYPLPNVWFVVFFACLFCLGLLYIYDGFILAVKGKSLLIGGRRSILKHIFIAGLIGSLIIEAIGNWLFKTWIYPYFSSSHYLFIILPFLGLYFLLLYENYLATVVIIEKFKKYKKKKYTYPSYSKYLFPLIGFIGSLIFILVTIQKLATYTPPRHFLDIFNTYWYSESNIITFLIIFISFWMIFEYLEYRRKEESFLLHLLRGDLIPLFAIIFGSLVTSIIMEVYNLPIQIWRYTNIPYHNTSLLGIPIVILLLWPFQYLLFISLYHVIYKKETARVWD